MFLEESQLNLTRSPEFFSQVTEESVGIQQYTTNSDGFFGLFKNRFADFLVNEIAQDGKVVRLSSQDLPVEASVDEVSDPVEWLTKLLPGDTSTPQKFKDFLARISEVDEQRQLKRQRRIAMYAANAKAIEEKEQEEARLAKLQREGQSMTVDTQTATTKSEASTSENDKQVAVIDKTVDNKDAMDTDASKELPQKKIEEAAAPVDKYDFAGAIGEKRKRISDDEEITFLFPTTLDKVQRKDVHQVIKKTWDNVSTDTVKLTEPLTEALVTTGNEHSTNDNSGEQDKLYSSIRVMHQKSEQGRKNKSRGSRWPDSRPPYLEFVMWKQNKDTMDAVSMLCRFSRMNQKIFSYAGTKDKRAITAQKMTAFKVPAETLRNLIKTGKDTIALGNFKYVKEALRLGDLKGNRFTLVLREVSADTKTINKSLEKVSKSGFINYYGMQRFGTGDIPTHVIGKAVLQGKWNEVIELILMPRIKERDDISAARKYFVDTRDVGGTLMKMPVFMNVELNVLEGLSKCGGNAFRNAFMNIPRNMRLMYVHAYQSYVWNHMTSIRTAISKESPIVGDLVLKPSQIESLKSTEDVSEDDYKKKLKESVKVLTQEDIDGGTYSIFDVVMPLVGHSVAFPVNEVGEKYKAFLESESMGIDSFFNEKEKDFSLPGDYRKVLELPGDLTWSHYRYNDPTYPLALNDKEILDGKAEAVSVPDGKWLATSMEFSLPSSTYATMFLREVTKEPTCNLSRREHSPLIADEERPIETRAAAITSSTNISSAASSNSIDVAVTSPVASTETAAAGDEIITESK